MKKILNSFLILAIGVFLMSLSKCSFDKKQYYNNLYLIDLNDKDIFDDARIKGAIHLSLDNIKNRAKEFNKNFKLIFYCSDYFCPASDLAAKAFHDLEFTNLFVYNGGIQEWYQLSLKDPEAYPFEGLANLPFLKMDIEKSSRKNHEDPEIRIITAQDLSKLLKVNKAA